MTTNEAPIERSSLSPERSPEGSALILDDESANKGTMEATESPNTNDERSAGPPKDPKEDTHDKAEEKATDALLANDIESAIHTEEETHTEEGKGASTEPSCTIECEETSRETELEKTTDPLLANDIESANQQKDTEEDTNNEEEDKTAEPSSTHDADSVSERKDTEEDTRKEENEEAPLADDEESPNQEEDTEGETDTDQEQKQFPYRRVGMVVLVAVVITFLVVGLVVWVRHRKCTKDPLSANPALGQLLRDLPSHTLENLEECTSQRKAWNWLSGHQDLSNLPEWRKQQLFAMATVFYAFKGEKWYEYTRKKWLNDANHECLWAGYSVYSDPYARVPLDGHTDDLVDDNSTSVDDDSTDVDNNSTDPIPVPLSSVCDEVGQLTALSLKYLDLEGQQPTIPPEIALLTSLVRLEAQGNDIAVSFDDFLPLRDLPKLTDLTHLNLARVVLKGSIPTELGTLSLLTRLQLPGNELSGTVPTELWQLTSLEFLDLGYSQMTGKLPTELGLLTNLTILVLNDNDFTGQLVTEIGLLSNLESIYLYDNHLTGTIPSELGLWTFLGSLDLRSNQFSGPIPSELGYLFDMSSLYLLDNLLSGQLPTELGQMDLRWLKVNNNQLTGQLPTELGLLTLLTGLFLQDNLFSGSIPSELSMCINMTDLYLSNLPLLSGPIPTDLASLAMETLGHLSFTGSSGLTGTIPEKLCYLQNPTCVVFEWAYEYTCSFEFDCTENLCGCQCACSGE